ncbi:hypothetical protein [Achromobacter deleyi]|uniref:hypothetical protein n=1 Tax=Achromobacter deleyi TaxID=1353891 RepID=UPI001492503A|nr:hypothetical protein [Achromobacter deleyi]QVQ28406.1 hypothetical protein HLG70_08360 [Achromobacter deleyi]UIP18509.1 hypothetical protein LYZ39_15930 [Achromobacter deleyi]
MTSISSVGSLTAINPIPASSGDGRAVTISNSPAVPSSTSVTLGQGAGTTLTYSPPSSVSTSGVAWDRDVVDPVSTAMANAVLARTAAGRLEGVASALLARFKTDGGNFSQSAVLPRASESLDGLTDAMAARLPGQSDDSYTLRITTASGAKVAVTLGNSADGLAVQIEVTDGELSEVERNAIAGLSKSFQDAVDGLASVPPRMALAGLTKFDTAVLSSVSLQATSSNNGVMAQTIDFVADSKQRSLTVKSAAGVVKVDVDVSKPAVFGNEQQRAAAVGDYLQQFDAAQGRGKGDADLMALFKDAFTELHKTYEAGAAPSSQAPSRVAAGYTYRSLLSGVADFSASVSQTLEMTNPYKTSEIDQFTYQVAQSSSVSGRPFFDLAVKQEQSSNLAASYHTALTPQMQLELSKDKDSQNYRFYQINDKTSSQTDIRYEEGLLAAATLTQSRHLSMRVQTYMKGELVDDNTTPVSESKTRSLLSLVQAAELEPSEEERLQRRDPAQADAILLAKHVSLARSVARERQG